MEVNGVYHQEKHLDQAHVLKGISASKWHIQEIDNRSLNEEKGRKNGKWEKRNILQNHQDTAFHWILGVMTESHQRQLDKFSFNDQTDKYASIMIILLGSFD